MKNKLDKLLFFLGFFSLIGLKGINDSALYLPCFLLGANFSIFWWSKLKYSKNNGLDKDKDKAGSVAFRSCLVLLVVLIVLVELTQPNFELINKLKLAFIFIDIAIGINLWAFLTYRLNSKRCISICNK